MGMGIPNVCSMKLGAAMLEGLAVEWIGGIVDVFIVEILFGNFGIGRKDLIFGIGRTG